MSGRTQSEVDISEFLQSEKVQRWQKIKTK